MMYDQKPTRIMFIQLFTLTLLSQISLTASKVGFFIGTDTTGTLTAGDVCNSAGGRLAIIDSSSKFTEASSVASSSGYLWVIIALHCSSRDSTCSTSSSKWTWYDSRDDNTDLCDISQGDMDTLTYYQTWDQWNKDSTDEYCVEFYGGKFVLEACNAIDEILIVESNAALCQPLTYDISDCLGAPAYFIATDSTGILTASQVCTNVDGRLAIIDSDTKFTEASSVATASGYKWVVVALHCASRDTSCSTSASKWTWFDSYNNNKDLCDISQGDMDTLTYYQTWDQWDKTPDENEYCVEFYGGLLVLEFCSNPDGIVIDSGTELPNAALCQPLSYSIDSCSASTDALSFKKEYIYLAVGVCVVLCIVLSVIYRRKCKKAEVEDTHASYSAIDTKDIPGATQKNTQIQVTTSQTIPIQVTPYHPTAPQMTPQRVENNAETDDLRKWLQNTVHFPQYMDLFVSNGYESLSIVMDIYNKKDLEDIGITLKGHQTRIMKQIEILRNNNAGFTANVTATAPPMDDDDNAYNTPDAAFAHTGEEGRVTQAYQ